MWIINKFLNCFVDKTQKQEDQKPVTNKMPTVKHYPYTKQDSNELFRQKKEGEQCFSNKQVTAQIEKWLNSMEGYGYPVVSIQSLSGHERWKNCRRKVYVRFECNSCRDHEGKRKRWTSILGNLEIAFYFVEDPHRRISKDDPRRLKWKSTLYREICRDCHQWADCSIFESQLKACLMDFGRVISEIMDGKKRQRVEFDRKKLNKAHFHREDLCEACQKGICFNIPREEEGFTEKARVQRYKEKSRRFNQDYSDDD